MKKEKKLILISIVLLVIIIILASFVGIYKLENYKVKNINPDYKLSMEFKNSIKVTLEEDEGIASKEVYDSEKNLVEQEEGKEYPAEEGYLTIEKRVNPLDCLTKENYKECKNILEKRLKKLGVEQYFIKQNEENGKIEIQIPENEDADNILGFLELKGEFKVTDEETDEVLLNKSHVENSSIVYYTQSDNSVLVALKIDLNKEGKNIFSEMSKKYISTTENILNEETGKNEQQEKNLNVNIKIDEEILFTYYFRNDLEKGLLNYLDAEEGTITIPVGLAKDNAEQEEFIQKAENIKELIDSKEMPIAYVLNSEIVSAEITNTNPYIYIGIAVLAILCIINIAKFKLNGAILSILQVGYIALLLLVIRYTKVIISLEGMIGILISGMLNFVLGQALLKNIEEINKTFIKYLIDFIPFYVITVVFALMGTVNLISLGTVMFWGIILMFIYNVLCVKPILQNIKK